MLGKYFKQRDNPWELLAIASWFFAPGLALLLYSGPALILKRGRNVRASAEPFWGGFRALNRTVTPAEVHTFGWCAVIIAAFLLALYFYIRWTKTHGPSTPTLLVTIANCYDINEAFRLQMVLGIADIPSFIPDETTAQNVPYFFIGSGAGVRLQVAEEDASEAQRIISNAREVPEARNDDESNQDDENEQRF
jgi:hypothetical protein